MCEPQLIVVSETTDALSGHFCEFACHRGVACARLTLEALAMRLSIRIDADGSAVTQPEASLLIRALSAASPPINDEERFHCAERVSALWSVAALSKLPVVNRPNGWGFGSRTTISGALMEYRLFEEAAAPEMFWQNLPPKTPAKMLHQEVSSGRQILAEDCAPRVVRSRAMPMCLGWDRVIVVDERPFRITTAHHEAHDIEADSVAIARRLGLAFCAIAWGIRSDGRPPVLANVNAFPSLAEVAPVWFEVRQALLEVLLVR